MAGLRRNDVALERNVNLGRADAVPCEAAEHYEAGDSQRVFHFASEIIRDDSASPQAQLAYEPDIDDQDALTLSGVLELLENYGVDGAASWEGECVYQAGLSAPWRFRAADYDRAVTILKGMIAERW